MKHYLFLITLTIPFFSAFSQAVNGTLTDTEREQLNHLCELFFSTNLPELLRNGKITGWECQPTNATIPDSSYCSWTGVTCSQVDQDMLVTNLRMSRMGIKGRLPPSLGYLGSLDELSFDGNFLIGSIPDSITMLTSLRYLNLNSNTLNGTLPSQFGNLRNLIKMHLFSNGLSGSLPKSIGLLQSVQEFLLFDNHFTGYLPSEIGLLSSMLYFVIYSNRFTGKLPSSLGDLNQLREARMQHNKFSGSIPSELAAMSSLIELFLESNKLTGSIPASLGEMKSLQRLYLFSNNLLGSIPSSLGKLNSTLTFLLLENNFLTSTIPESLGGLSNLLELHLQNNSISGQIPSSLGKLTSLVQLYLFENTLTGSIAPELSGMKNLQYLVLFNNSLTSSIPTNIGDLSNLRIIQLNNNKLTGTLPMEISKLLSMQQLFLFKNSLSGSLPSALLALRALQVLQLSNNRFTGRIPEAIGTELTALRLLALGSSRFYGTIPASIGKLGFLQMLDLSDNLLYGTVPQSFSQLSRIASIFLFKNILIGSLSSGWVNATNQIKLENLDISKNKFEGTITGEIFKLPRLRSFAAVNNCLYGAIPSEVCLAGNIVTVALDGMGSQCQKFISLFSESYILRDGQGIGKCLPTCLFTSLPNLATLHLSGNGIEGKLPEIQNISASLINLSLSHNIITGTIPHAFKRKSWKTFDLSFNKITGTTDDVYISVNDSKRISPVCSDCLFTMRANRLSGRIPSSIVPLQNVSLVDGNIFQCNSFDRSDIPENDPYRLTYKCGSDAFEGSIYTWITVAGILMMLLAGRYILLKFYPKKNQDEEASVSFIAFLSYRSDIMSIYSKSYIEKIQPTEITGISATNSAITDEKVSHGIEESIESEKTVVSLVGSLMHAMRSTTICLTAYIIVVLLPTYLVLSAYYGTHSYEYAWIASYAYLSGLEATVVVGVFVFLATSLCIYLALSHFLLLISNFELSIEGNGWSPQLNRTNLFQHYRRLGVITAFNCSVVAGANMLYIYLNINSSYTVAVTAQLLLAAFQLTWNDIVVPRIVSVRVLKTVTHLEERNVSLRDKNRARDNSFIIFTGIVNNILIPCLAMMMLSSDCLNPVLIVPPAVSATYSITFCMYVLYDSCYKSSSDTKTIPFQPPFNYSYQCSSALVTSYAAVFVYQFCAIGFLIPLAHILVRTFYDRTERKAPGGLFHSMLGKALPSMLRPSSLISREPEKALFDINLTAIKFCSYLLVIITFGAAFPPLAFVGCITVIIRSYFTQTCLSYAISERKKASIHDKSSIGNDCSDSNKSIKDDKMSGCVASIEATSGALKLLYNDCICALNTLQRSVFFIALVSALFHSLVVFDMLGDDLGAEQGVWGPIIFFLSSILAYFIVIAVLNRKNNHVSNKFSSKNDTSLQEEVRTEENQELELGEPTSLKQAIRNETLIIKNPMFLTQQ